jgi:membrane protein
VTALQIAKSRKRASDDAPGSEAPDRRVRSATTPAELPKSGWWDIFMRVKDDISEKNLSLVAAGTAFYALLAIPAAITALVSLYGLAFDP